jgi:DNA repair exonuclease SbcCD ATPase subunit
LEEGNMHYSKLITIAAAVMALAGPACNTAPAPESERDESSRADTAAAELERKRNDAAGELEKRVTDLERRWTEMESKIAEKAVSPTVPLRAEVKEDVKNVREAVAELKTTNPENWWERHERTMERTAADIEADVRQLAKGQATPAAVPEPETPVAAAPFESRRDRFVARMRARVEAMEEQLKNVRARDAQKTELEDTRARVGKLKDDVDRLRNASADDWWDISSKRVSEYVDRLEDSIRRLDDNKTGRSG